MRRPFLRGGGNGLGLEFEWGARIRGMKPHLTCGARVYTMLTACSPPRCCPSGRQRSVWLEHLRAVCGRKMKDHRARRRSIAALLDIAARHDPREAHTHLLQAANGCSLYTNLCASTHPDLRTASITASSAKAQTLTIRSICRSPYSIYVAHRRDT